MVEDRGVSRFTDGRTLLEDGANPNNFKTLIWAKYLPVGGIACSGPPPAAQTPFLSYHQLQVGSRASAVGSEATKKWLTSVPVVLFCILGFPYFPDCRPWRPIVALEVFDG
jgi:hypothetical protein